LWRRSGCGLDVSRFWCRALVPIALLCGLGGASAWADKAKVTTFFQPNGSKSLSVSGLTPFASYSVCLGLITDQRQCDFAQGKVTKDGTFVVNVPTTAGMAVANFSFAITKADGSVQNWRRIGDTDGKAVETASELEKGAGLNNQQDPSGTQFASSTGFVYSVPGGGNSAEFDLTSSDTSEPYMVSSALLYEGLDPSYYGTSLFDSPTAIATGILGVDITDNIIPVAGGPADPSVSFNITPIDPSGYELLVATVEPIIDIGTGELGPPETFDMAIQPVPEPGSSSLLGGLLALALVRRRGARLRGSRYGGNRRRVGLHLG
jgi:hypothetical protein